MIAKLTWRNLWRNRRRTLITMSSVTFAVFLAILMQSFQKGIFDNLVNNVVSFYYGYIQVHKQGYWNEQVLDNSFFYDDSLVMKLSGNPDIKGITPRIETFLLASVGNTTKGCMLVGTDPVKENLLTGLEAKIVEGKYFTNNEQAVLIAEGLAGKLKLSVDDTIILFGQGYHGAMAAAKYPVRGIVHFGSPALNDGLLYLPLTQAQFFLSAENMLTSLAVGIHEPEKMPAIQQQLLSVMGKSYEVMNWKELMPDIANHIKADGSSFYIFTGILYLIIAFGIFGTILMMTAERQYEFGMLIAIGMKKISLGKMLLFETLLITLLGVILGLLISLPFVFYFDKTPLRITGKMAEAYERFGFEALFPAAVNSSIFITQSLIVLVIAFLIGLYPLWHVSTINPVLAMKK
ncbi:MAG: ABC transporter permease [Chitinophagaceae bacterium]|jgi:ABC-type lipoprotein release transport system permease subunit|nr:ABC transporter permease [Chitinophagaceae bacterium]